MLRDQLEADIGHRVGWDLADCPTCGAPLDGVRFDDDCTCRRRPSPAAPPTLRDPMDLDYLGTAASATSERAELDRQRDCRTDPSYLRGPTQ